MMNSRELAKIDPLATRDDAVDEIGAVLRAKARAPIVKAKPRTKAPNVKVAMRKAKNTAADVKRNVRKAKNTVKDVRKVTRNPIVLGAIGATAAVVPVGSVVAGVATVGLAAAEAIMAIADSKVGKAIGTTVGGAAKAIGGLVSKKQRTKNRSKRARKLARKVAKGGGTKAQRKRLAKLTKKGVTMSPTIAKALPKPTKVTKEPPKAVKPAAQKIAVAKTQLRMSISEVAKILAKMMVAADRGDKQAMADLAAVQVLASPDGIANQQQLKQLQVKGRLASQVVQTKGALTERFMASALKEARKLADGVDRVKPPSPKTKAANAKIQAQVKAVTKKAGAVLKKAVAPRLRVQGVRVTTDRKVKRGSFVDAEKGPASYLVDAKGLVKKGVWS